MSTSESQRPDGVRPGLGRYVARWVVAGAAAVAVGALVLDGGGSKLAKEATVAVPPLRQTSLGIAAARAHCTLAERVPGRAPPAAVRARSGILGRPLSDKAREAALRHGFIVIEYRGDVGAAVVEELRTLQRAVPTATVLAPSAGAANRLTVSSAGRRLRCGRASPTALDALRLFRGRFVGTKELAH